MGAGGLATIVGYPYESFRFDEEHGIFNAPTESALKSAIRSPWCPATPRARSTGTTLITWSRRRRRGHLAVVPRGPGHNGLLPADPEARRGIIRRRHQMATNAAAPKVSLAEFDRIFESVRELGQVGPGRPARNAQLHHPRQGPPGGRLVKSGRQSRGDPHQQDGRSGQPEPGLPLRDPEPRHRHQLAWAHIRA